MRLIKDRVGYSFALLPFTLSALYAESAPQVMLAKNYQPQSNLQSYWISEKYDGVRAIWTGKQLITRHGHKVNAPKWFTDPLPDIALDGELWVARGKFDQVSSIVRKKSPNNTDWKKVKLMVFDLPHSLTPFNARLTELNVLVNEAKLEHLQAVPHFKVNSHDELQQKLDYIIANNGEGLMLHKADSLYQARRSNDLQKLKPFDDAEATVISHIQGKGKYQGMLGALLVENSEGIRFKIGSGFDEKERKQPPEIGTTITYRYRGKTKFNKPRFATFLRVYQAL